MKAIRLLLVWLWVALPLGWGVLQSVRKAMPLIAGRAAPSPAAEPPR